jgi:small-conductance mechanosensitive channel
MLLGPGIPDIFAQRTEEPSKASAGKADEVEVSGYPVVLGDQTLFFIKEVKGLSAKERAKSFSNRLEEIAEDVSVPIASITVVHYESPLTLVGAGGKLLLTILDEDAKAESKTRLELANERVETLRKAVEKYRRDFGIKSIFVGSLFILIATVGLLFLLIFLNKLHHRVDRKISEWVESKKISVHIQKFEIVRADRIRMFIMTLIKISRLVVFILLLYIYAHLSLGFLPWTRTFADQLLDYILGPLQTIGSAVWAKVPGLIFLAIIILITVYVEKTLRHFFNEVEKGTITLKGFYPEWARPTYRICRFLVVAFAAVMAFPYIPGSDSLAFKGISIFIGVLFSLGSTSFIANILAGYSLTYRRVFSVGDRVKIADFTGDVVETGLQVTHLQTIKNEEIIVPNSMIVNSHVINYSSLARKKGLILHTTVSIGYDAPWRQVHAMLLMAAEKTAGLLREPAPFVLQKSLDDFYVTYELNAYTDTPQGMARVYSELHKNIQDAFNEYGVQIMSPAYESDPDRPKIVPKDRWYAPPAKTPDTPEKEGE